MNEIKNFNSLGIRPELVEALAAKGISEPTPIEREAIPRILAGKSLIGEAPTGTGKTLSYLLPIISQLSVEGSEVQALVLAPTYELSMQIANTARDLLERAGLPFKVQGLIGGANISRQIEKLKEKPTLLAGSTGRILELVKRRKLSLKGVRFLVLDEFDRLLDDQNLKLTADLMHALPPLASIQVLLFSATAPKKALERASFLGAPERVVVEEAAAPALREDFYRLTPFREKVTTLRHLTRRLEIKRGLVFIGKRFDVARTLEELRFEGIRTESLVSASGKQERQHALDAFRRGKVELLLATDVAARGLDIEGIDYIINLDVPEDAKAYVHRAGRTARAGAKGTVLTLLDQKEAYKLEKIARQLKLPLKPLDKGAMTIEEAMKAASAGRRPQKNNEKKSAKAPRHKGAADKSKHKN